MKNSSSIAKKYADVLFEQALAKNELRACQQGLEEIARISRLRPSLVRVVNHPFIPFAEKFSILKASLGEYATPLLERFLKLLIQRKRFDAIQAIAEEFQELVDRHQKIQPVRVKVAYPLSPSERETLEKKLASWLKSTVRLAIQVDPALIGGIVLQTRDGECDRSLRGQLRQLRQQLTAG